MITITLTILALWQPLPETPLERGLVHVESRGSTWAVSYTGARGRWQVQPASLGRWCTGPCAWALHVPRVGQWAGRGVLARWLRRAGNRCAWERTQPRHRRPARCIPLRRALAAYRDGVGGLRGKSGWTYADDVLSAARRRCLAPQTDTQVKKVCQKVLTL